MKLSEFRAALREHPDENLTFILPGGGSVPSHAHVTEVGRTLKTFVDCGGKLRQQSAASLQIWVADDTDHRLPTAKLARIMEQAGSILGVEDPEVQIECQQGSVSLFAVAAAGRVDGALAFTLANRQTGCLAMDVCLPDGGAGAEEGCCGDGAECC
jgi:hypothetical protein